MNRTDNQLLHYVVRSAGSGPESPAIGERLPGARAGWLVERRATDARQAWRALQGELGPAFQVLPLLRDEAGEARYPTGEVVVRFRAPVTGERLAELAASSGLRMIRRSAFTQNQAVFRPLAAPAVWAPDLLQALCATNPDVEAAWLDAESHYRRGE